MTPLTAALITFGLLLAGFIGFCLGRKEGHETGWLAGSNSERAHCNARVIKAKLLAFQGGVHFAFEHHDALMSRRAGNVASTPSQIRPRFSIQ